MIAMKCLETALAVPVRRSFVGMIEKSLIVSWNYSSPYPECITRSFDPVRECSTLNGPDNDQVKSLEKPKERHLVRSVIIAVVQVEVDDDDEAIGDDGDDGYNPNDIKIKSGVAKGVLDQVRVQV